jgi:hypothetical protein
VHQITPSPGFSKTAHRSKALWTREKLREEFSNEQTGFFINLGWIQEYGSSRNASAERGLGFSPKFLWLKIIKAREGGRSSA